MSKIADNIKLLLKEKDVTQAELARRLGMTTGGINHYIKGKRTPSVKQLKRIARALGVTVQDIIKDDALITASDAERELLELIRAMPEPQQAAAVALLRSIAPQEED